jgi:hypothetical protein
MKIGPVVSGILGASGAILLRTLPKEHRWIGALVLATVDLVQVVDRIPGLPGHRKATAVADALREALDYGLDDAPGFRDLPKDARSALIEGTMEVVLGIIHAAQGRDLGPARRETLALAASSMVYGVFAAIDVAKTAKTPPPPTLAAKALRARAASELARTLATQRRMG